jgi:polyisoprenoid-binding protein YceI
MRMLKMTGALLLMVSVGSAQAEMKTYKVDPRHSEASFQVRHMMVAKVRGRFTEFTGEIQVDPAKPETGAVQFTIQAKSVNTGVDQRDNHLRSDAFFDVEKFPEITFKSEKIVAKGPDDFEVTGPFTMHGVTKQVTLPVKMTGKIADRRGDRYGFEVTTVLNRKDYGINYNKVLDNGGVQVGDEVTVDINLEAAEPRPEGEGRPRGAGAEAPKEAPKEPAPATK